MAKRESMAKEPLVSEKMVAGKRATLQVVTQRRESRFEKAFSAKHRLRFAPN